MNLLKIFRNHIDEKGLNHTPQREEIVQAFSYIKGHYSAKEFCKKLSKKNPEIGATTVYRTLKLLVECGLAEETIFDGKTTKYEYKNPEEHHDHLICTKCGKITEFKNERIEAEQEHIAKKHCFQIKSHKFQIYGLCNKCHTAN